LSGKKKRGPKKMGLYEKKEKGDLIKEVEVGARNGPGSKTGEK